MKLIIPLGRVLRYNNRWKNNERLGKTPKIFNKLIDNKFLN